ncbi:hypothetical protein PHLCEN_2v13570 [Hermanssonia centrifuga]|uniref:Uncharacterized protein n=1 Tax=Hermanssonia centrifuga TaxID=98765 RepID=A0A2R6NDX4_9APHY|nr:hypothetical protein PHLCEN_2v13570 [Hermanssonia centrifuga]
MASTTMITPNMDSNHHHTGLRDSPSHLPASHVKYHLPYFTPEEVERFSERQRGKLSVAQEEKQRQQACGFIEAALDAALGRQSPPLKIYIIDFISSFRVKTFTTM